MVAAASAGQGSAPGPERMVVLQRASVGSGPGITDLTSGTFQYGVQQDSYPVPATPGSFSLHTGNWTMSGGFGQDTLHAELPGYTLDLRLQTTEPAALHGSNGIIPFRPFGTSASYSWTSLLPTGTITDHGVPAKVAAPSLVDPHAGPLTPAHRPEAA